MRNLSKAAQAAKAGNTLAVGHLRIGAALTSQETVTVGDLVFEVDTEGAGAFLTSGNIAVDLSGGSTVAAQGTLTIAEPVTADDTLTLGATVYTFKAGATAVAGEIGLGADEAATKLAIVAAINGTDGFNTANASVSAAAFATDDCVLTALEPGTAGNSVVSTETFTHVSNVLDAATIGTTTAGVDPTAAEGVTAFAAAFLAQSTLEGYAEGTTGVTLLVIDDNGSVTVSETLAGSGNEWEATTLVGKNASAQKDSKLTSMVSRAATAAEVTSGFMTFGFGRPPVDVIVQVRTAAGIPVAWVGAITLSGRAVRLSNVGATDWASTDIVTVLATFA